MSAEKTAMRIGEVLLRWGPDLIELAGRLIDAIDRGERVRAGLLATKAATLAAYKRRIRGL